MKKLYTILPSIVFLTIFFFIPFTGNSEGTEELNPSFGDDGVLQIWDGGGGSNRRFMTYAATEDERLNIRVCDHTSEKIFIGLQQNNNDVYMRVRNPNDNIVLGPMEVPDAGDEGWINTYNEAVEGPAEIRAAGGYNALELNPSMNGNYYIEFNVGDPDNLADGYKAKRQFTYFDATVADISGPDTLERKGRLWSREWDINTQGGNNEFKGTMFVYSNDSIITSIDFNGIQPWGFTIGANRTGVQNTGNPYTDRQSVNGNVNYPSYRLFLNEPDTLCYGIGKFGNITDSISVTGCDKTDRCINMKVNQGGPVQIVLDINKTGNYEAGSRDRLLSDTLNKGWNCIEWNGRDGFGNIVEGTADIPIRLDYFNGITHLPLYDVENHPNGYIVKIHKPLPPDNDTTPKLFWDDSQIGGGTEFGGCNPILNNGCHSWTSNFGNERTINTWWYANVVQDTIDYQADSLIRVDADTSNATNDTTLCDNQDRFNLRGRVSGGASEGEWTTTGNGTFSPSPTDETGTYIFADSDFNQDTVKFYLKSTNGKAGCPPVTDSLLVTFKPGPAANGGQDDTVCANNRTITLNGSFSNASSAYWQTLGSGSFNPDSSDMNATYVPSDTDTAAGSVQIVLNTISSNNCPESRDTMQLTINPAPLVDAGNPDTVCANNPEVSLNGSVAHAGGGTWSGGNGSFSPDANTLNATYTPTASEISSGEVTLALTSTNNGLCDPVTDSLTITINPAPNADPGSDQVICSNTRDISLNGSVTNASGGQWTTSGSGSFADPNSLSTTYTTSDADTTNGEVWLYLTTTGNGNCNPVTDSMHITIDPGPSVDAGSDFFRCANNADVTLNGAVTNAGGGEWLNGNGTFTPNNQDLNADYSPSQTEKNNGQAALILRSTNNGGCDPVQDTLIIHIAPKPGVDAGPDQTECANDSVVTLNGSASNAGTVTWMNGNGTFDDPTSLNTTYAPTQTEINNGSVELVLRADRSGCNPVYDTMTASFNPAPTVNAGPDQTVCANNRNTTLNGTVSNASGGQWSTSGSGSFADPNSISTSYTPSDADTAAGSVWLYLTSTGNGDCNPVTDSMQLTINPAPIAEAGPDDTVCANNSAASLNGSITRAGGATWSGGSGTFTPTADTTDPVYNPTNSEISSGEVTLYMTTTVNGNCSPVTDSVNVIINPEPVVNAGPDDTVCADNPAYSLSGSVTNASGGTWTGGGGSFNPGPGDLNATYNPSNTEISNGEATLTLNSTGNGNCNSESDNITITIKPRPTVDAGSDQEVCASASGVSISGSVTGAGGGQWSTSGSGSFNNPNNLTTTYNPSDADTANGSVNLILKTTGTRQCLVYRDTMQVTFTDEPMADAGPDQTICTNEYPVQLNGSGSEAKWSTSGSGTFVPHDSILNAEYIPSSADSASGSVDLSLSTVVNSICPEDHDTMTLTIEPAPIVDAGPDDTTICGNQNTMAVNGAVQNAPGATWSTTGSGSFDNPNNLSTSYNFSSADKTNGSVNLVLTSDINANNCDRVRDTIHVNITPEVVVNAGNNLSVCKDTSGVRLNGQVQYASGGTWTTAGSGSFTPNPDDLNAVYQPSSADTANGSVWLYLTSTGNGVCNPRTDSMQITFTPIPTVDAGPDHTVCADTSGIEVSGNIQVASGGEWTTTGSGSFTPDNQGETTTYIPSEADTAAGSVDLILTTTGNAGCNRYSDTATITITPTPNVDAGPDKTICADTNQVSLNGNVAHASGGTWTTSGSGSFANPNDINTNYTLSAGDAASGSITLTLTSTGNGNCNTYTDKLNITIEDAPVADAGNDRTICANNDSLILNGSINNATGGTWQTLGSGTFSDVNDLSASYYPSDADTAAGSVSLVLRTNNPGICSPDYDTMQVTINPAPIVEAGLNDTVCADTSGIPLSGSVANASGGQWTTAGSGNFFPSSTNLNATYAPSEADTANGAVWLYLTSSGNGSCNPVTDSVRIEITPAPIADAGTNKTICADSSGVPLSGAVTHAAGGNWTSSGSGSFTPASSDLNASYIPSNGDTATGSVTLTLTTTGNGLCRAKSDNITINIRPVPDPDAGPDQTVCSTSDSIRLDQASVNNASGAVWQSSGSGIFDPGNSMINPAYEPSTADKNSGSVQLSMTTTGNGVCRARTDTMTLAFDPVPEADAGSDKTICGDTSGVLINGTINNATGAEWTTLGSGNFYPNRNAVDPIYAPSSADTAAGEVKLVLRSTGNGACNPARDTVLLNINPTPIVDAGPRDTICASAEKVALSGSLQHANKGYWTTMGSGSFGDSTRLNATYTPSEADKNSGDVTLTFTSNDPANYCKQYSDQTTIHIDSAPVADAGPSITICRSADTIAMNGILRNAGASRWETNGTGTFHPDRDSLQTYYAPSKNDTANRDSLLFKLFALETGACQTTSDTMKLYFESTPTIDAGPLYDTVCTNELPIRLKGSGTNGVWRNGNGTFDPDSTNLNAEYSPTASEISSGSVKLMLSSASSYCPPARDSTIIEIPQGPSVDAGADQTVCADTSGVSLNGSFSDAGGVQWSSSGSGSFNNPNTADPVYTPSSQDISDSVVTLTIETTGSGPCREATDRMKLYIQPAPTVDAGRDRSVCADTDSIRINGSVTIADGGTWSTYNGNGSITPDPDSLAAWYHPTNQDTSDGVVNMVLTTRGNGICKVKRDTMQIDITPAPVARPGGNQPICSDSNYIDLNGKVWHASGGRWSTSGSGSFSPNNTTIDGRYNLSNADKSSGSIWLTLKTTGNGTCRSVQDSFEVPITPAPSADAGNDQNFCTNNDTIFLNGAVTNAPGGYWESSGTGTFHTDSSDLTGYYLFSNQDKNNDGVTLKLTTNNSGVCEPAVDYREANVLQGPEVVEAGYDRTICADDRDVPIEGEVRRAGGGVWSTSGTGTFNHPDTILDNTYIPSDGDTATGNVILKITTTQNGICPEARDSMELKITPAPEVDAGADQTVCADTGEIPLNGNVRIASGGEWTTSGDGSFTPNANTLNASYIPGPGDKANGSVGLTLTSTGNGNCNAYQDSKVINITPQPTVNAGPDDSLCANVDSIRISGSVSNAGGGQWTTYGSGSFTNGSNLNTWYKPSKQDRNNGQVVIELTTTGTGMCKTYSDKKTIHIPEAPAADAGNDQLVCANTNNVSLSGSVTRASGGRWSTLGNGTFTPDNNVLNGNYHPSAQDQAQDSVRLVLTTKDNKSCNPETDTVQINFRPKPEASISGGQACADITGGVQLNGSINNASGVEWTTSGSGTFAPNIYDQDPEYTPSAQDAQNGNAVVTMKTTGNGVCPPAISSANVIIKDLPEAEAGANQTICRNDSTTIKAAVTENNVSYQWQDTTGNTIAPSSIANVEASADTNFFVLKATDQKGCSSKDTMKVAAHDPPQLNLTADTCFAHNLSLQASPKNVPSPEGGYQWYRNDTLLYLDTNTTLNVNRAGEHRINYAYKGCKANDTALVHALPPVEPTTKYVCDSSRTTLTTTSNTAYSYDWYLYNRPSAGDTTATAENPDNHEMDTVIYRDETYLSYITDNNGCTNTDTFNIKAVPKPAINLTDSMACEGDTILLDGEPSNIISQTLSEYEWQKDGTVINQEDSIINVHRTGIYSLSYNLGECTARDTANISINPNPEPDNQDRFLFCLQDSSNATLNAGPGHHYKWLNINNPAEDTLRRPTVQDTGTYYVDIFNKYNCKTRDSVEADDVCDPRVYVPDAFVPDNDGKDEYFQIFGDYFTEFKIKIFNRWGEVIYESTDPNFKWDGTYRGKPMPQGSYPYIIEYKGEADKYEGPYKKEDKITIIR